MTTGKAFAHRKTGSNFFPTPYSMTEQLFEVERFDFTCSVLEPACGAGHMVKVLKSKFNNIDYYDLEHKNVLWNDDFYKETQKFDYIISNPPYGVEADKFVIKAKQVCRKKFAFLLRTNFLSGQARLESGVYDGLKNVWIFSRMPDLGTEPREDGKYKTAMIVYAWMVFEIGYKGAPRIGWIDNQKFVLKKGE